MLIHVASVVGGLALGASIAASWWIAIKPEAWHLGKWYVPVSVTIATACFIIVAGKP